jgi:hypothetical protein
MPVKKHAGPNHRSVEAHKELALEGIKPLTAKIISDNRGIISPPDRYWSVIF